MLSAASRAPRGARGLKWQSLKGCLWTASVSCPSRGTWIEMFCGRLAGAAAFSRAPRGARGLKSSSQAALTIYIGRAPRGARGLK